MSKVRDVATLPGVISDGATVFVGGIASGHLVPEAALEVIENSFLATGHPRDLTIVATMGFGDPERKGLNRLAHEGMVRRIYGSSFAGAPRMLDHISAGKVEAYVLPGGVLSLLCREVAAGRPGLVTPIGLGTYVDPREEGAKANAATREDYVRLIEIGGREALFYPAFPFDVALLKATTADEDGNLTLEHEPGFGENLAAAQAARNSGGTVIAQVKRLAARGSLPGKSVKVPGCLVDVVVVVPGQEQTYARVYDPGWSGELKVPASTIAPLPLDERKVIARRAAQTLFPGAVVNLGFGMANGISFVAAEEGISEHVLFTIEQGLYGGIPAAGRGAAGAATNFSAVIETPSQFDFYHGGGLDLAFLSFAELDREGNVNASKLGGRPSGPGGFIDISQRSRHVVFCGSLSVGAKVRVGEGRIVVAKEGHTRKCVERVSQITYRARDAARLGHRVTYITDRAVFELREDGLVMTEIAPGLDRERDVFSQMEFRPNVAPDLRTMDPALFTDAPARLARTFEQAGRGRWARRRD